jgi:hypothetical protein
LAASTWDGPPKKDSNWRSWRALTPCVVTSRSQSGQSSLAFVVVVMWASLVSFFGFHHRPTDGLWQ